ncbi:MAG: hypothetical protein FJ010_02025 [Chloroflexi bacterium]|nr:hypothetical protein [Chloroflexota bacterium]
MSSIAVVEKIKSRVMTRALQYKSDLQISRLSRDVARFSNLDSQQKPVAFFNVSSRLGGISQNAAFTLLTSWGLQFAGSPVVHFACRAGMSRCVLGMNPDDHTASPPCETCVAQSKKLLASTPAHWFEFIPNEALANEIYSLDLEELSNYQFTIDNSQLSIHGRIIPLGELTITSLRWALRQHHLPDDEAVRHQLREYILSAYRVAETFDSFLTGVEPAVVVLFNGLQFPEATARWVTRHLGIRTITHEVSFQPFSAFFTEGDATAYPIEIPDEFELSPSQNARLEAYLSHRFQGEFTMAGIRFWPEMSGLDKAFLQFAAQFEQIVAVFTNVVFDTSQLHANTVFPQMFAWLDLILEIIKSHPETLFVIRAHPDEKRPGTRKQSRESVSHWVAHNGVDQLPNVIFIDSGEYISSYDLIRRAKFVMVYNSSIGLEATLLDTPVLCGGKARFTQYPIVHFPQTPAEYRQVAEEFLASEKLIVPEEFERNARRFLYYQLFRVSLPFDEFIEAHPIPGYVQLKPFSWRDLQPEHSPTLRVVVDGILDTKPFVLSDE